MKKLSKALFILSFIGVLIVLREVLLYGFGRIWGAEFNSLNGIFGCMITLTFLTLGFFSKNFE